MIRERAAKTRDRICDAEIARRCVECVAGAENSCREAHDMALKLMEQAFFDVVTAADIGAIWSQ